MRERVQSCRVRQKIWLSQQSSNFIEVSLPGLKDIILVTAPHCNENPIYVFLFWELLGLSPNFPIHISVSEGFIYS